MINLGTNEYDRINSQYRRIANQLDAGRIRTAALEELGTEWCKKSIVRPDLKEDACFSWPPVVVEARKKKIEVRLIVQEIHHIFFHARIHLSVSSSNNNRK